MQADRGAGDVSAGDPEHGVTTPPVVTLYPASAASTAGKFVVPLRVNAWDAEEVTLAADVADIDRHVAGDLTLDTEGPVDVLRSAGATVWIQVGHALLPGVPSARWFRRAELSAGSYLRREARAELRPSRSSRKATPSREPARAARAVPVEGWSAADTSWEPSRQA